MAKCLRNPVRERQWRERVMAWAKSVLYCRLELRERDEALSAWPVAAPASPWFVPLKVLHAASMIVEVRCPSGHVVTLPSGDASALSNLFGAWCLRYPGTGRGCHAEPRRGRTDTLFFPVAF